MLALYTLLLLLPEGLAPCEPLTVCHEQIVPLEAIGCDGLIGYHYDSGWIPDDDEIQLRLVAQFGGQFNEEGAAGAVEMDSFARLDWGSAPQIAARLYGERDAGRIYAAYGIRLTVTIRYDVEWEGIGLDGEVDIPIPLGGLESLNMEADAVFDPLAFPSSSPDMAEVRASSDRFTLFEYDVIGQFFDLTIDIGFDEIEVPVSGGFRLDVETFLDVGYQTQQIMAEGGAAPITAEGQSVALAAGPEGYGAHLSAALTGEGRFECALGMTFLPTLFIEIAGHELSIDWPIDVDLQEASSLAALAGKARIEAALPDITVLQTPAQGAPLRFENQGAAPLTVTIEGGQPQPRGPLTLPPRGVQEVRFNQNGAARLLTNDPDQPLVTLQISGVAPASPDGGPPVWEGDAAVGPPDPSRDRGVVSPLADRGVVPAEGAKDVSVAPSPEGADGGLVYEVDGASQEGVGALAMQTGGCACRHSYGGARGASPLLLLLLVALARRRAR